VSRDLAAGKTLATLDRLKQTVEDIAARADKLGEEFRSRTTKERRRCELAVEEQQRQLSTALVEAGESAQAARAAAEQKFEQRKARIGRAYQSSKEQGLKQIEDNIGARKYELQKRVLQAEKDRAAGLAAATAAFEQFRGQLAAEQDALAHLETTAQGAFKGYRGILAGFFKAYEQPGGDFANDETKLLDELRQLLKNLRAEFEKFQGRLVFRLFRYAVVWVVFALLPLPLVALLQQSGNHSYSYGEAAIASAIALTVILGARFLAAGKARPAAGSISQGLARARRVHDACAQRGQAHHEQELERIKTQFAETTHGADHRLKTSLAEAAEQRVACRRGSDERTVAANQTNERQHHARLERLERAASDAAQRLRQTTSQIPPSSRSLN
jgi:hypothetical protein